MTQERLNTYTCRTMSMVFFAVVVMWPCLSHADWDAPYFFDDFEDGDATDGNPVKWTVEQPEPGTFEVIDGDLVVTLPDDPLPPGDARGTCLSPRITVTDASFRAQVKYIVPGSNWATFWSRGVNFTPDGSESISLESAIRADGLLSLHISRLTPDLVFQILRQAETDVNPFQEIVNFQFDVFGEFANVTVWPDGQPKPSKANLDTVRIPASVWDEGQFGLCSASFDNIEVPPQRISYFAALPTPHATLVRGDFDENLVIEAADIDLLSSAVRNESADLKFDINLDNAVDSSDREYWVHKEKWTYFGDANLDGEFNSADFVEVFQTGQYEDQIEANSTWSTGDWDGDAEFTSGDFVVAFQDGGYEKGPIQQTLAVPEPTAILTIVLSVLAFWGTARRRSIHPYVR